MTAPATLPEQEVLAALAAMTDPELDESIVELGIVRSVVFDDDGVTVRLWLPNGYCSPDVAYLVVADTRDALRPIAGIGDVRVLLEDHPDSSAINARLAAGAVRREGCGDAGVETLDGLRRTLRRKAHMAAMERCVRSVMDATEMTLEDAHRLTLRDLPADENRAMLLRRRRAVGLSLCRLSRVVVDEHGCPIPMEELPIRLRIARSVRTSLDQNARICRRLLAVRCGHRDDGPDVVDVRTGGTARNQYQHSFGKDL